MQNIKIDKLIIVAGIRVQDEDPWSAELYWGVRQAHTGGEGTRRETTGARRSVTRGLGLGLVYSVGRGWLGFVEDKMI